MLWMAMLALLGTAQAGFDHSVYDQLLRRHVNLAGGDYAGLAKDQAALGPYVRSLATADMRTMARRERIAFWVNAHNALTLHVIARHYPLRSISDLDEGTVRASTRFLVAGQRVSLKQIETVIVPHMGDPRIHAALNVGARGSPPLANSAYQGVGIESQLEAASLRWSRRGGIRVDRSRKTVRLCSTFATLGRDFVPTWGREHFDIPGVDGVVEAGINFFAQRHDPGTRAWLQEGGYAVVPLTFNWDLNDRRGIR